MKLNYIQLYTCDLGGWLDSDMKINFHIVALIGAIRRLLLLACLKHSFGLS